MDADIYEDIVIIKLYGQTAFYGFIEYFLNDIKRDSIIVKHNEVHICQHDTYIINFINSKICKITLQSLGVKTSYSALSRSFLSV